MTLAVRIEDVLVIPAHLEDFVSFRHWAHSKDFPERGRIDFLAGTIEVDMSPEELQTHGAPKAKLCHYVYGVVEAGDLGQVFVDRARLSSPEAELSCEPDILFVSWEALESGRVRYVASPKRSSRLLEVEGSATLAVEVISDSSVGKDRERLPPLYARAGVEELWVVDARTPELQFQIYHLEQGAYRPASADADGYHRSRALSRDLRLWRDPGRLSGTWRYGVDERPA